METLARLKVLALIALQGRQAAQTRKLVEHDSFMQWWHIGMRYSANGTVSAVETERWKDHANQALGLLL